jgi:hypothetical protein
MKITEKTRKALVILFTFIGYTAGGLGVYLKWKGFDNANYLLVGAIIFVGMKWVLTNTKFLQ